MKRQIIQVMSIIGIVVNLYLLALNHYLETGNYFIHALSFGFFLGSLISIQISKVV